MSIDVLTAEQVAEALGCTPEHVNTLAACHKLPAVKFGRSWRFPLEALNRFLDEQATANLTRPSPVIRNEIPVPSRGRRKPPLDPLRLAVEMGMTFTEFLDMHRPLEKKE